LPGPATGRSGARPEIIAEVKRQYENGSIITLCWHAVAATADEPVTFRPMPEQQRTNLPACRANDRRNNGTKLITPGTGLYNHWCAQVDVIASYLKTIAAAHIPGAVAAP